MNNNFVEDVLHGLLGEDMDGIVHALQKGSEPDESLLIEPLRRGFDYAKTVFDPYQPYPLLVPFESDQSLPTQGVGSVVFANKIAVPHVEAQGIVDRFTKQTCDSIDEQLEKLEKREDLLQGKLVVVRVVGAASKNDAIYSAIQRRCMARWRDNATGALRGRFLYVKRGRLLS